MVWDPDDSTTHWAVGEELPPHNDSCAVCGSTSAWSPLVAHWRVLAEGRVGTRARFDARHQGAPTYAHGGAVAAVLDDAMGYVSFVVVRMFVTARLEVDYRRPVLLDRDYEVEAWCTAIEGRKVHVVAQLLDDRGVVAEATGLMVTVDLEHFRP